MHKSFYALAAAALALAALPATLADTTVADISLGNTLSSDFNDGPQGWTASEVAAIPPRPAPVSTWAWGAPTSGPNSAASGSNVWATNLAGNYNNNECGGLMSPPIDLTGATSASFSFDHWRHLEQSSSTGTAWDAGTAMVTTDGGQTFTSVAASGYSTNTPSTAVRTCWDGAPTTQKGWTGPYGSTPPAPVYTTDSGDLSAFVGQTIQVVLAWGSDGSINRAGWYVDDFAITIDGSTTVQDFESGDGGFTIVGTKVPPPQAYGWSHGAAGTGPAAESDLWATNPNGKYGPNECNWIESPEFQLSPLPADANAVVKATLSWSQWYRSGSTTGAGVVQIGNADGYTIIAPDTGYGSSPTSTILDACLGHLGAGLGAFAGLRDVVGAPMTEFQSDISEFLGQTVTVRFLFASTSSTTTYEGWYVDDVNVNVHALVSVADPEDLLGDVPGVGGADAPGWTQGGPISTWSYGVTSTNPVGQTTYKTNLNGNHDANECSYIQSPAVPGALIAGNPTLTFNHWHRIPGVGVNVPWAAGIVLVSGDGGATWQHLAMDDYNKAIYQAPSYTEIFDNCLAAWGADINGGGYGKDSVTQPDHVDGWYTSVGDLSAYVDSPTVQIRFAYASDGTFAYEGWAIRSVDVGGVKLL